MKRETILASRRRHQSHRLPIVAVIVAGTLVVIAPRPAGAQVTGVTGSAYGYFSNVSLFGGPANARGPAPTVALPAGGSASPVTATAVSGSAVYGPATIFSSGQLNVSTQGTAAGGSVTSTTSISNVGPGPFTAGAVTSTCTASQAGTSGAATITTGTLVTKTDAGGLPVTTVSIPANPPVNDTINGTIDNVGDSFKYVFNEQVVNPDGSITVNAGHEYLLGPTAVGDLIFGQAMCGVTPPTTTTTTVAVTTSTTTTGTGSTTTTTGPPGSTTTTSTTTTTTTIPSTTTTSTTTSTTSTTAPTTTTTTPLVIQVGGGATGFSARVSLFGGPVGVRGPAPTVTLPPGGSATPVTASAPSANAVYGPATIFSAGQIDVSTEGSPAGGSVTSSTRIANAGPDTFKADLVTSTCTASQAGTTASTTITNGILVTKTDANSGNPVTTVPLPANPPVNDTINGTIDNVGDSFRFVFNEHIVNSNGSITVNAGHEYLLGPAAVGDLIFGQSICGVAVSSSATAGVLAAPGGSLAATGDNEAPLLALALLMLTAGWAAATGAAEIHGPRGPRPWMSDGH